MARKIEQRPPQRPAPHITQQNLRPQTEAPDPPQPQSQSQPEAAPPQPEESLPENERRKSFSSLIGTAVLGVAFACAAVPYSLGWLTPQESTEVVNAEEPPDERNELDSGIPDFPVEEPSDLEFSDEYEPFPLVGEHTVNKTDDTEPFQFDESSWKEPDLENLNTEFRGDPSLLDTPEFPELVAQENAIAETVPEDTNEFAIDTPLTSSPLPTGPPVGAAATLPTFAQPEIPATPSPARQQPQAQAPPKRPPQPPPSAVVGVNSADIVARAPRDEHRSLYGHSENVRRQPSGHEAYAPNTTHPMSENVPPPGRHDFDDPWEENDSSDPPLHRAPPERLEGPVAVNRSEVRPRYADQSLQGGHDDDRDPRDQRITPSDPNHPQPQQQRRRRNSREPYQLQHAQMRVRQDIRGLPNDHGQIYCEYDISSFTKAEGFRPGSLPEQTIVNWIKKQTGEQTWHAEPFGILSASRDTLSVYHTPKVQGIVAQVVDRFVNPRADEEVFTFRIVSLNGPNWLSQSHGLLKPIRIDSPGARGWLLEKEDHARLIPDLSRRSDYKELCSSQFPIRNGWEYEVSSHVPKNYTPDAQPQNNVWPGYATEVSVINEGYKLLLTPLLGVDGATADIMIQCESLQVEKMHSISLNVNNRATSRQRIPVEAPQIAQFHLEEQIVWPKDKILLLSLGTVPVPAAAQFNDADGLIPGISRKISGAPAARGHILLIVECRKL